MQDYEALSAEWKKVWNTLPADERARLEPEIRDSHDALLGIRSGDVPTSPPARELAPIYSLLHDDRDGLLADSAPGTAVETTIVGPDGQVYFGGVQYDSTDFGWAYCPLAWYWTQGQTPSFNNAPATIQIPNKVTIALLGDWGGNNQAARDVARSVKRMMGPQDVVVHLGDVYYAGTNESGVVECDYEDENFLKPWPGTPGKSFALNSNHDMYASGTGYFNTALASPIFSSQKRCSYFSLYNDAFRIVGLDTAYYDRDRSGSGFMIGTIGPTGPGTQAQFLNEQAQAAAAAKQQLILLTHHNGLQYDGSPTPPLELWDEVIGELAPVSGGTVIWYWGHEHMGVTYTERATAHGITIRPRCCGHSCIPWGVATGLNAPGVEWYEHEVLRPGSNYFVANGFATLALDDASISETFYRQDGAKSWGNHVSVQTAERLLAGA